MRRVAIIGGGISGLAAAHRLGEIASDVSISLFESADRLGGVLGTIHRDGFLIEGSADNFITNVPRGIDLCRRVGLGDALLPTSGDRRQAFVVRRGRLCKIPDGFLVMAPTRLWPMLASPILGPCGKLRLAAERFLPRRREADDESLAHFARRRLGRQAYERLVQPLVGGIYTGDPERLSATATMPRFVELEERYGSLLAGLRAERSADAEAPASDSGARYSLFVAPRDGMSSLVDALAARIPRDAIRLRTPVAGIQPGADAQWQVALAADRENAGHRDENFDAVIVAAPAHAAARITSAFDGELAADLAGIEHAGAAVVVLAYDRAQIAHPLDGFGCVVPLAERRRILSASFASIKYAGRAPDGKVLMRVFIGGACQSALLDHDDASLREIAHEELASLVGIAGPPRMSLVYRWHGAMPQYTIGHVARVERIEAAVARHPGFALAGNAYRGVGIPQCIRSGEEAAERIAVHLREPHPARVR